MKDLIIIGAGGMGREAAFIAERMKTWNILGFLDGDPALTGEERNGYPVFHDPREIKGYETAAYVCAIGRAEVRKKVIEAFLSEIKTPDFASLIDPSVILSDTVEVGEGSIIAPGSVLTVNIKIGRHCLINMNCTLGHDAVLEDFATLYPSVNVSGNCVLKTECEMGTGAQIIQGLQVGEKSIVGAGAVVIRDIPENVTAVGCPAEVIKIRERR